MPKRRTVRSTAADSASPSGPASAKPADSTMTAGTSWRPQSSITAGTSGAGTQMIARSTGPPMAARLANAGTPATWSTARLTG
jgi:hypothetical protein